MYKYMTRFQISHEFSICDVWLIVKETRIWNFAKQGNVFFPGLQISNTNSVCIFNEIQHRWRNLETSYILCTLCTAYWSAHAALYYLWGNHCNDYDSIGNKATPFLKVVCLNGITNYVLRVLQRARLHWDWIVFF